MTNRGLKKLGVLATMVALVLVVGGACQKLSAQVSCEISSISWENQKDDLVVRISATTEPTYTMYELFEPQRVVIDIANSALSPEMTMPMTVGQGGVDSINAKVIDDAGSSTSRVELLLSADESYDIDKQGSDLLVRFGGSKEGAKSDAANVTITDVQVDATTPSSATILLYGSGPLLSYVTSEEKRDETHSSRLIIDLPNVKVEDKIIPVVLDSPVALVQAKQGEKGGKIIIDSSYDALFTYDVKVNGNYLELNINAPAGSENSDGEMLALLTGNGAEGDAGGAGKDEAMLPMVTGDNPAAEPGSTPAAGYEGLNNFSGYNQQRISVDFYKIDLHNVFRLIGEISNRNIIVDESVTGSLTLSMKDVPWDFLLDVVLNLKDLAKEERFNTIVISPKSEGFSWPESVATQLEVTVEPITVTKRLQTSREQVEAKKLIHEAAGLDEKGQTVAALAKYEQAMQLWPDNGKLAEQIAVVALVKLGQNAKAAHYAKIAVQQDPTNAKSALIAAMSLANMENIQEAKEYFDLAVSGAKPSRHALASYAAFSEQNESYESALNLLNQYDQLYGTSLETMISRARIYDAMGDPAQADSEYKAILLSGFELPADLKSYVMGRVR